MDRELCVTEDRVKLMIKEVVDQAVAEHEKRLRDHLDERFDTMQKLFASAFPGGDPHGHRIAHEKAIKDAEGWDKIKRDAIGKIASAGLVFGLGWAASAMWAAFRDGLK